MSLAPRSFLVLEEIHDGHERSEIYIIGIALCSVEELYIYTVRNMNIEY